MRIYKNNYFLAKLYTGTFNLEIVFLNFNFWHISLWIFTHFLMKLFDVEKKKHRKREKNVHDNIWRNLIEKIILDTEYCNQLQVACTYSVFLFMPFSLILRRHFCIIFFCQQHLDLMKNLIDKRKKYNKTLSSYLLSWIRSNISLNRINYSTTVPSISK